MYRYIYLFLIFITFIQCKKEPLALSKIEGEQIKITSTNLIDSSIVNMIQPYQDELSKKVNTVLCYNPKTLSRESGELESDLGNLYADICYNKTNPIFYKATGKSIDFALFNYGGIRTAIPKGNVTVGDIFKLMPFENKLVVVELEGEKIKDLFNYLLKKKQADPISNLKLVLDNDTYKSIKVNGKDFDIHKNYYVLTHDYLQHGGDRMVFFKHPVSLFNTQIKVRDALLEDLASKDTLKSKLDGRFIKIQS